MKLQNITIALRLIAVMTLICGGIYPLLVTGIARFAFAGKAEGSLVYNDKGEAVGSALIAQKFRDDKYFWPRPSAGDFATIPSAASNKGPTSAALKKSVDERRVMLLKTGGAGDIPADLVFASGSGLDPHISKEAARFQAPRIAAVRKFDAAKTATLYVLIDRMSEGPEWGIWGETRVNVLLINRALDKI